MIEKKIEEHAIRSRQWEAIFAYINKPDIVPSFLENENKRQKEVLTKLAKEWFEREFVSTILTEKEDE